MAWNATCPRGTQWRPHLPRVTHHLASSPRKPRTQGHRKRIRQRRLWRATDGKADILLAFAPRTRENWHEHDGTDHEHDGTDHVG